MKTGCCDRFGNFDWIFCSRRLRIIGCFLLFLLNREINWLSIARRTVSSVGGAPAVGSYITLTITGVLASLLSTSGVRWEIGVILGISGVDWLGLIAWASVGAPILANSFDLVE